MLINIFINEGYVARPCHMTMVRFRILNKKARAYVDKNLWAWIHSILIPNMTGLPCDLLPQYYLKLIGKYLRPAVKLNPYRKPRVEHLIRNVFFGRPPQDVYDLYPACWVQTAGGREHIISILDQCSALLMQNQELHRDYLVLLEDARHTLRYGFIICPDAVLQCSAVHLVLEDFNGFVRVKV